MTLETQEVFELLEKACMNPEWCDTPVPYFDTSVQAGFPTNPGDIPFAEQLMMAKDMVKGNLTFCINVRGESMRDANIMDGDRVEIMTGVAIRDGDIVIAEIDEEYTLKSYYTDGQGIKWLVPANEDFNPIMLTEDMNVRILGKVTRVFKEVPHIPYAELLKCVNKVREQTPEKKGITMERVEEVICEMGEEVKDKRRWYAVFRALVDAGVYDPFDYEPFANKVAELLPMHNKLPVAAELRRMHSLCFTKKVILWKDSDAPVHGHHFRDYLRLAQLTLKKLQM